jgi:hypothetical protein
MRTVRRSFPANCRDVYITVSILAPDLVDIPFRSGVFRGETDTASISERSVIPRLHPAVWPVAPQDRAPAPRRRVGGCSRWRGAAAPAERCPARGPRRATHHDHAVGNVVRDGEIVADEDAGETVSGLQLDQQVENGCLTDTSRALVGSSAMSSAGDE